MFCPNCGTSNDEGALFCANCGTRLEIEPAVTEGTATVSDNNAVPQQPEAQPQVQEPQADAQAQQSVEQPEATQENAQVQPQMQAAQVNMQPQVTPMYEQPQADAAGNTAKKPFKLTKQIVIIGAAAIAVIAAVIVFICVGNSLTNYKKTAKAYVKAVEECDWAKAYSLIQIPEDEFLTKNAFVTAHSDATGSAVGNIKVIDSFSSKGRLPGNKAVSVIYTTATGADSEDLLLTVTDKHYMLFFKKYKVSTEDVVVSNCTINVPKGLTLFINDILVGDQYKKDDSGKNSSYDVYEIPYLFNGTTILKATSDFTEDYKKEIYPSYDDYSTSISSYDIKFSEDKISGLKDQAKKDVTEFFDAAQKKNDFSTVSDKFTSDMQSGAKSTYNGYVDTFKSTYKQISNFKVTSFTASMSDTSFRTDSSDGCPTIKVGFKIGYSYTYKYSNDTKSYDKSDTKSSSYIYYKYVDGQWKISSMGFGVSIY